ncbi:hypothetical protein INR49_005268 [Caranx melampygus]|nr:hypothetical protein INR49_005268 [Caranx melampygus]
MKKQTETNTVNNQQLVAMKESTKTFCFPIAGLMMWTSCGELQDDCSSNSRDPLGNCPVGQLGLSTSSGSIKSTSQPTS